MDFSVWTESGQLELNAGSESETTGETDAFAGFSSDKFGQSLNVDSSGISKDNLDGSEFHVEHSNQDADSALDSWNLGSPGSGIGSQSHSQLLWDSGLQFMEPNRSAVDDGNSQVGDTSFNKDLDTKDFLSDSLSQHQQQHQERQEFDAESMKQRQTTHKRDLSDTYTMRVPLVARSYNDSGDLTTGVRGGTAATLPYSPDLSQGLMQTPVRGSSASSGAFTSAPDGFLSDSPSCLMNGLESPLESPALQGPYLPTQPFPMASNSSASSYGNTPYNAARKLSGAGSPRNRRKSSSGSQSSLASFDSTSNNNNNNNNSNGNSNSNGNNSSNNIDNTRSADTAPQTPRTRTAAGVIKAKHTRTASSLSVTPKALSNEQSAQGAAKPTTPLRASNETGDVATAAAVAGTASSTETAPANNTPTQTPTPARDGKKDGRKRIAKEQIDILEAFFHKNPRPEREDRLRLAAETNLEQRTVQIWFQNRRAKSRSMKMPPSKADTTASAMQFRAAQAAAAAAGAGAGAGANGFQQQKLQGGSNSMISPQFEQDYWSSGNFATPGSNNMPPVLQRKGSTDGFSRQYSMSHVSPVNGAAGNAGNFPMSQQFSPHHQRWSSVSSPSTGNPMMGYHQQLPKHGVPQSYGMASQMQRLQQMQQAEQMQAMQQMQSQQQQRLQHQMHQHQHPQPHQHQMQQYAGFRNIPPQQQGSSGISPIPPPMNRSQSLSMFEPFMSYRDNQEPDFDAVFTPGEMMSNGPTRSDSLISLTSMNSAVPPSPMANDSISAFSPDLQSLQNSPELVSPVAWPSHIGRTKSSVALHSGGGLDYMSSGSTSDVKRRRSLYGNSAVPNWSSAYDVDPMSSSRTSPTNSGTSIAASAAAAALRTRNRSYTQPTVRSRQPSVRLQLDESNNAAQLVVLPDDQEMRRDARMMQQPSFSEMPNSVTREMSPGRAERAAERLLAERAAAATTGRMPSKNEINH